MKESSYRVGIDIVNIRDFQESVEVFGDRFLNRIFTMEEQQYCMSIMSISGSIESFAARFAAKEAAIKVLRPDPSSWLSWLSIEVCRSPEGCCDIALHEEAAELAARREISELSVSLSHEADYATAVVVASFQRDLAKLEESS